MNKLCIFLIGCSIGLKAQSFHRAAVILQTGAGIEGYHTQQQYSRINGLGDTTIMSSAASSSYYGGLEIGLNKRIGFAARGKVNTFFTDVDQLVRQKTTVNTADMLFAVNLHPIVRKKFDLVLGAETGFSNLDLSFSNLSSNLTSARGSYSSLYIEPRFYKKRLGFHIRASLPFAQYKSMTTVSENVQQQKFTISGWKGSGFGISAGLQLRLF